MPDKLRTVHENEDVCHMGRKRAVKMLLEKTPSKDGEKTDFLQSCNREPCAPPVGKSQHGIFGSACSSRVKKADDEILVQLMVHKAVVSSEAVTTRVGGIPKGNSCQHCDIPRRRRYRLKSLMAF